jgi:hypothetical protein
MTVKSRPALTASSAGRMSRNLRGSRTHSAWALFRGIPNSGTIPTASCYGRIGCVLGAVAGVVRGAEAGSSRRSGSSESPKLAYVCAVGIVSGPRALLVVGTGAVNTGAGSLRSIGAVNRMVIKSFKVSGSLPKGLNTATARGVQEMLGS